MAAGIRASDDFWVNDGKTIWSATARRLPELRQARVQTLEASHEHFLTWDAEFIARRAFDRVRSFGLQAAEDPALEWSDGTAAWLGEHQLSDGSWKCTTGPGEAYFTAVGALLLADD